MSQRVGFIGLGSIGKPMAANVARAGHDLMVFDLRPEPVAELASLGAKVARNPHDIGRHADIIELVVMDDAQVEAVTTGAGGVLETTRPGSIIVVHSSVLPASVRALADASARRGVQVIDAPITGGITGAAKGTLCCMAGGDPQTLERCRPVLQAFASNIFHLGATGAGATAKVAHNLIAYINRLAAAEGFALAEKAGIDPRAFSQVVRLGGGQSMAADTWLERAMFRGDDADWQDRMHRLFYKDLNLALALGHELSLPLQGGALALQSIDKIM
ncbi:MAG: NAD(P)-dependent oxidoreductase [Betaproteobacteria bacterium]|nr:NAD(P)-dependent oxidoreductase [Betaproteobacteria bacterium]